MAVELVLIFRRAVIRRCRRLVYSRVRSTSL